ncbi:hypothetical protein CR973_02505 [Candidatus Saccharibacteria bacterium]|nr:MAG: hypothetical protein CR973_02505 [Candidatus Saccharibacteria bacterium]
MSTTPESRIEQGTQQTPAGQTIYKVSARARKCGGSLILFEVAVQPPLPDEVSEKSIVEELREAISFGSVQCYTLGSVAVAGGNGESDESTSTGPTKTVFRVAQEHSETEKREKASGNLLSNVVAGALGQYPHYLAVEIVPWAN